MPYSWLVYALTATALFLGGALTGWHHEHNKLVAFQAEVAAAGEAQEQKTRQIIAQHDKSTKETADAFARRIADVRAHYRVRTDSGGSQLPTDAKTTGSADAATADSGLVERCAETTVQLVTLQDWVKEVSQ